MRVSQSTSLGNVSDLAFGRVPAVKLVREHVINGRALRQFESPLTCVVVSRTVFGLRFTRPADIHHSRKLTRVTMLT
jgi:hypothetical protein